jgi:hypothetical protein
MRDEDVQRLIEHLEGSLKEASEKKIGKENMKYIIKHAKTGQYFNIKHFGLDLFNLGINPKVYENEDSAIKETLMFPALKEKQLQILFNSKQGLFDHGRPRWYEERHTKKLTKRQTEKLEWYESAHKATEKKRQFIEQLQVSDLVIEEYSG